MDVMRLRSFALSRVGIRLDDASERVGTLRTELLSDESISVYLTGENGEGATIYIDDIVDVWKIS